MTTSFDLANLGAELDASRRLRYHSTVTTQAPSTTSITSGVPIHSQPGRSPGSYSGFSREFPALSKSVESSTSVSSVDTLSDTDYNNDIDINIDIDDDDESSNGAGLKGEPSVPLRPDAKEEQKEDDGKKRPYHLCLLCLTRPPSAVLLPCCHLNLCYICAPLLIHKSHHRQQTSSSQSTSTSTQLQSIALSTTIHPPEPQQPEIAPCPSSSDTGDRIPFNILLMRATANHPKSRKLALGGYRPPKESNTGGEYTGEDLLPRCSTSTPLHPRGSEPDGRGTISKTKSVSNSGFDSVMMDDQRVQLKSMDLENTEIAAKCLICRQGVKGWLRVYTG